MSHFAVNWVAVILATVVSWGFGAGWYIGAGQAVDCCHRQDA